MPGRSLVFFFALLAGSGQASADIYTYTDAGGVRHFSNVPSDPRFELFLRSETAPTREAVRPSSWRTKAPRFDALVDRAARQHRVDAALIRAVIAVESAFDPRAVSPRGARGLMQLADGTARRFGVVDPFNPEQNVHAGTRYLRGLLSRYNDVGLALAAYNAGEAAVERYGRRIPPFAETQAYVPAVLRIYRELQHRTREPT